MCELPNLKYHSGHSGVIEDMRLLKFIHMVLYAPSVRLQRVLVYIVGVLVLYSCKSKRIKRAGSAQIHPHKSFE